MKTILFLGNSLTAGYGLQAEGQAFPELIQQKIDSLKLPWRCVNAGVSGETSAGGRERVAWLLRQPVDVLVLELGANDGLRGLAPPAMENNLQAIWDSVQARYPQCQLVLCGMEAPPNLGPAYTAEFRQVYGRLAQRNSAVLVPFLLEGVAGDPALNQPDGIHPTAAGHQRVAATVWRFLLPLLQAQAAPGQGG